MTEHRPSTRAAIRRAVDAFRQVREAADEAANGDRVPALFDDIDAEVERARRVLERFLRVEREAQVIHEEHDVIALPPGLYSVRRQREYPLRPRPVAD